MQFGLIYKVTSKTTGKSYIGKTENTLDERRKQHIKNSRSKTRALSYFLRALRKYGPDDFIWEELEYVPVSLLAQYEILAIEYYDTYKQGYNLTLGGEGVKGLKLSEETRKRMSLAQKQVVRKPLSEETKQKIANSLKGRKGRSLSEEEIKKLSLINTGNKYGAGKIHSAETRRKRSESLKGIKRTPEQNLRNSESHKGKKMPIEQRTKISRTLKERFRKEKVNAANLF